ncbi:hypothetical protein ACEPAG_8703 [Sanghuangporus baumii]
MDVQFHLIVPSNDNKLYDEWKSALDRELSPSLRNKFDFVRARLENLPNTKFDAIVSPANSYGRMDGAFDDAISKLLSPSGDYFALTRFVQAELYKRYRGFAEPGSASALLLPENVIDSQKGTTGCKYLILCPTMHWPQDISWDRDIVYNTTWSLLIEIERHNSNARGNNAGDSNSRVPHHEPENDKPIIRSILMPGLGTGTGKIPQDRFASQFALAVKNFDEAIHMPKKWSSLKWDDVQPIIDKLESTWSARS